MQDSSKRPREAAAQHAPPRPATRLPPRCPAAATDKYRCCWTGHHCADPCRLRPRAHATFQQGNNGHRAQQPTDTVLNLFASHKQLYAPAGTLQPPPTSCPHHPQTASGPAGCIGDECVKRLAPVLRRALSLLTQHHHPLQAQGKEGGSTRQQQEVSDLNTSKHR
jgi:hypothetical protein